MTDPELYLTLSLSGLAGLAMVTTAGLSGWRSWLTLKHSQLDAQAAVASECELTVIPP